MRKSEEVAEPPPQRETERQRCGRARRWRSRPRNAKQKGNDTEERGGGGAAPAARNRKAATRKSEEVAEPPPQRETEGQRYGRARRWRSRPRNAKQKGNDTEERGGGGAAPAALKKEAALIKIAHDQSGRGRGNLLPSYSSWHQ